MHGSRERDPGALGLPPTQFTVARDAKPSEARQTGGPELASSLKQSRNRGPHLLRAQGHRGQDKEGGTSFAQASDLQRRIPTAASRRSIGGPGGHSGTTPCLRDRLFPAQPALRRSHSRTQRNPTSIPLSTLSRMRWQDVDPDKPVPGRYCPRDLEQFDRGGGALPQRRCVRDLRRRHRGSAEGSFD